MTGHTPNKMASAAALLMKQESRQGPSLVDDSLPSWFRNGCVGRIRFRMNGSSKMFQSFNHSRPGTIELIRRHAPEMSIADCRQIAPTIPFILFVFRNTLGGTDGKDQNLWIFLQDGFEIESWIRR